MKTHKANFKRTYEYKSFGQYHRLTTPLCDKRYPWNRKMYKQARLWKDVDCKKCLMMKDSEEKE